jgi:hypothetical protein
MSKYDGLWLFVAVTAVNVVGLLVDYMLMRLSVSTVTQFCQRNPWFGLILCVYNAIGGIGLAYHLFLTNGEPKK